MGLRDTSRSPEIIEIRGCRSLSQTNRKNTSRNWSGIILHSFQTYLFQKDTIDIARKRQHAPIFVLTMLAYKQIDLVFFTPSTGGTQTFCDHQKKHPRPRLIWYSGLSYWFLRGPIDSQRGLALFLFTWAPMREMRKNNLGDLEFFSYCVIVFVGFFGAYIIPKWLIKVPGHIAILSGWFRELRKIYQNLDL